MRIGNFEVSESNRFFGSAWVPNLFVHKCVYLENGLYGDERGVFLAWSQTQSLQQHHDLSRAHGARKGEK